MEIKGRIRTDFVSKEGADVIVTVPIFFSTCSHVFMLKIIFEIFQILILSTIWNHYSALLSVIASVAYSCLYLIKT